MGILGLYVAYRAGKRRAMRDYEIVVTDLDLDEICAGCKQELRFHSNDANLSCPISI